MKFVKILFKIVFCMLSIVLLFGLGAVAEKAIGVTDKVMNIFNEKGTEHYAEFKANAQDLKENEWIKVSISGSEFDAEGKEEKVSIKNLYINSNTITDAKGTFKATYTLVPVELAPGFTVNFPAVSSYEVKEDGKFVVCTAEEFTTKTKINAEDLSVAAAITTDMFFMMFDDNVFDEASGNYFAPVAEGEEFDQANYVKITKEGKKMFIAEKTMNTEGDTEYLESKSSTTLEIVTKEINLEDDATTPEGDGSTGGDSATA